MKEQTGVDLFLSRSIKSISHNLLEFDWIKQEQLQNEGLQSDTFSARSSHGKDILAIEYHIDHDNTTEYSYGFVLYNPHCDTLEIKVWTHF